MRRTFGNRANIPRASWVIFTVACLCAGCITTPMANMKDFFCPERDACAPVGRSAVGAPVAVGAALNCTIDDPPKPKRGLPRLFHRNKPVEDEAPQVQISDVQSPPG